MIQSRWNFIPLHLNDHKQLGDKTPPFSLILLQIDSEIQKKFEFFLSVSDDALLWNTQSLH